MNSKSYILLLSLFLYFFFAESPAICQQPPVIEWQQFYSCKGWASSVVATNDGGSIILANIESNRLADTGKYSNYDIEVIKLGVNGELQWQTFFGSQNDEFAESIIQTRDGGYAIVGSIAKNVDTLAMRNENRDVCAYKISPNGEVEWQKQFGGSDRDEASSIVQLPGDGYLIAANTASEDGNISGFNGGSSDGWLLKLDDFGNLEWEKCFGGNDGDVFAKISTTNDGGFILAGASASKNGGVNTKYGGLNPWIIKLKHNYEIEWQKSYGGSYLQEVFDVHQSEDNTYVVLSSAGVYDSDVPVERDGDVTGLYGDQHDIWVLKLSSLGDLAWQKCIGGTGYDDGHSMALTKEGNYIIIGMTNSVNGDIAGFKGGEFDALMMQVNGNGNIDWQKCFGGKNSDSFYSIAQPKDGGYLVLGYTSSNDGDVSQDADSNGIWLLKFSNSSTANSKNENFSRFKIFAYPNPVSKLLTIACSNIDKDDALEVRITDITGNQVQQSISRINHGSRNEVTFDVSSLVEGVYYVTVLSKSASESVKVVVVK